MASAYALACSRRRTCSRSTSSDWGDTLEVSHSSLRQEALPGLGGLGRCLARRGAQRLPTALDTNRSLGGGAVATSDFPTRDLAAPRWPSGSRGVGRARICSTEDV